MILYTKVLLFYRVEERIVIVGLILNFRRNIGLESPEPILNCFILFMYVCVYESVDG